MTTKEKYAAQEKFKDLCKNSEELKTLLTSDGSSDVICKYFYCGLFLPQFETVLLETNPQLFIDSIRVNFDKSFLVEERLNFYTQLALPANLEIHKRIWQYLFQTEKKLWQKVEENLSQLLNSNLSLSDILSGVIVWFEEKRFSDPNNNQSNAYLQEYGNIYNVFINLFLREYCKKHDLNILSFEDFTKTFATIIAKPINRNLSLLLENIEQWEKFKNNILYHYCFDNTLSIIEHNNTIHFIEKPEDFYNWKLDGCRYELNKFRYFMSGCETVQHFIEHENFQIKGNDEEIQYANYLVNCQKFQTEHFLEDLKIRNFIVCGKEINVQRLFLPLLSFSVHKQFRYEAGLERYKKGSASWKEAFGKLLCESIIRGLEISPFVLMTKSEYIDLNKKALQELGNGNYEELIKLFSYTIDPKDDFQKFKNDYSVFKKPFVVLGEYLFCPTMFLNNDWFYAFANAGLENLDRKESEKERRITAHEMENSLGELFKSKRWDVKVFTTQESEILGKESDIDIAVNDGNTTLLMQLKRTKFRIDCRERYNERINSDKKASKQLNNAVIFIQNTSQNKLWDLKPNLHKWIVSTSFENILSDIEGCTKVNYFDLLYAFNNPNIRSLNDLITCIINDDPIKNLADVNIDYNADSGYNQSILPTLEDPVVYNIPLFADNNSFQENNTKFNKALELGEKKNFDNAIKILLTLSSENPNDYQIWSALANIYADFKDFENAYKCFEKALQIIPNDPCIKRNYALAHKKAGNHSEYEKIKSELQNKYWYINLHW